MRDTAPRPLRLLPKGPADPPVPGAQRAARIALVLVLTALGLYILHRFLPALVWGTILAIALWPLYRRVEQRFSPGRHNLLLPALFTALVGLVFLVPFVVLAVEAAHEAHALLEYSRSVEESGVPVPDVVARLPFGAGAVTNWWNENLAHAGWSHELLERFNTSSMRDLSRSAGAQVLHRAILFGFTLVTLFFLLRDGRTVREQTISASTRLFGPRGERVGRQMVASVHGTVDGLVLVGIGEGFLLGVTYYFAGVPHPILLGALTAVTAMIPFAAPLVFGAAAFLLFVQGSVVPAVVVVVAGLVVTFVADHFVRPALIGGTTRLPFLWVLLGILGGVETLGLLGLFVGPAVMAALMLLWREFTQGDATPVT
jgi:predicted PurR-regulated permease PerM